MEPIHLFVPTFRIEETLHEIRECLEKGWTGLGFKTVEFEEAWVAYTGLPYAHFLNSATAGLHLAIRLLKEQGEWREGDEVITTPLTFVSTNHAILYERLKPVFADVDEYLCLCPRSVEERITSRTRAVIFVGLGGNAGQLAEVTELCARKKLKLILDAAHMAGTRLNGRHVGAEADVSVFSFHAVKNLPTADAGMICFKESKLNELVRKWTWLGINKDTYTRTISTAAYKWKYDVEHIGFKYHGNSIMAAIALVGLKYLDVDNAYRRQISAWYDELLIECPAIGRIPVNPHCDSARHLYQVQVSNRDKTILALNTQEIYPGVHYINNTQYWMFAYANGTCPRADEVSNRLLSLPIHLSLARNDVKRVAKSLIKIVEGNS